MKKIISYVISFILSVNYLSADEGMWLLPLIKQLNMEKMNEMGLKLSAEDIYSVNKACLKDAIVIFGGGCTAEMISEEGLLITNHHCGYHIIQSHSSVEHDYLTNGFWAMSKEEEIPSPGLKVKFLKRIEDVSEKINSELTEKMTEKEREKRKNEVINHLVDEATNETHFNALVKEFFGGNQFYLFVYEEFKDIRFVGAPPTSIGKFGGDTDNWMWPRHTGDFSMFRVYADANGNPAEYSEENIPYKPKHFLPISLKGLKIDDFTMVIGFPGSTQRYLTSFGIDQELNIKNPNRIKIRGLRQDILLKDMMANPEVRIKYATKYSRSSNYWKYSIGQNKRIKDLDLLAKKKKFEEKFTNWVIADNKRKEKFEDVLPIIEKSYIDKKEHIHALQYISECFRGTELITFTKKFYDLQKELNKKEADSKKLNHLASYLKKSSEEFYKDFNLPTDKKVTKTMFKLFYEDVNKKFHPDIYNIIATKYKMNVDKYIDDLFDKSIFSDPQKLQSFLNDPNKKILKKDMAFEAAKSISAIKNKISIDNSKFNEILFKEERLFIEGILEMKKNLAIYPDANSTIRLTYGKVGGYEPRDAVKYNYFTTMKGIIEKEDPNSWEFKVPSKLKKLYEEKDFGRYGQDEFMPVCFITDNDITGGNSGSPVLNAEGELIGLAFDGNWEAMSGDIAFESKLQKCINVDIRYVLFIIDKFAGAGHLLEEMKIIE